MRISEKTDANLTQSNKKQAGFHRLRARAPLNPFESKGLLTMESSKSAILVFSPGAHTGVHPKLSKPSSATQNLFGNVFEKGTLKKRILRRRRALSI
jgi:hypothetical protein